MNIFSRFRKKTLNVIEPEYDDTPAVSMAASPQLIMDIGLNDGIDSWFYLNKGFKVVAIEADPVLVEQFSAKASQFIARKQFIIENIGIGSKTGTFTFYKNLENDQWSSFEKSIGTRNNTRYDEVQVQCVQARTLFEKYGIPYYLKVDIEHFDIHVVKGLYAFTEKPKYISVEATTPQLILELFALGYRKFQLVNQSTLWKVKPPYPAREGTYFDLQFTDHSSGLFGEELEGAWLNLESVIEMYQDKVMHPHLGYRAGNDWYDVHAKW